MTRRKSWCTGAESYRRDNSLKQETATATASLARLACLCLLLCVASPAVRAVEADGRGDSLVVRSPDGRVVIELSTRTASGALSQLQYRVSLSGQAIVDASNLGVRLADGNELGRNCEVVRSESVEIDSSFEQYPGKRRHVIDRATESTLTILERGAQPREWQLVVRAYDDGVALRYRFPEQPGWSDLELADELTEFAFPASCGRYDLAAGGLHHVARESLRTAARRRNTGRSTIGVAAPGGAVAASAGPPSSMRT